MRPGGLSPVGGIVGYVGSREAFPVLAAGLGRLEYRGADSAGVATVDEQGRLQAHRTLGRAALLARREGAGPLRGRVGIGHTRWATHGRPSVANAHPQIDCTGSIAVVHNGIIENHRALRARLIAHGHRFRSETDTEVVPHLIEEHAGDLADTVRAVLELLEGDNALAVLTERAPSAIAAARAGTPSLVVGLGAGERFVASDARAFASYTTSVLPLDDGELAIIRSDEVDVVTARDGRPAARRPVHLAWATEDVGLEGHPHFMHKEIHEQPRAVRQTFAHRVALETGEVQFYGLSMTEREWRDVRRVALVGCGSSFHAARIGRRLFEGLAHLPAEAEVASEFRDRDPLLPPGEVCVLVSQSGETADTLGALRAARAQGARTVAVCNVPGSALTREADGVVMTAAGLEVGLASTKTFTAQLVALFLMALHAGRARGALTGPRRQELLRHLAVLPARLEQVLRLEEKIMALATLFRGARQFFVVGRGLLAPLALEGAHKLTTVARAPAVALPAGELKHGALALVDRDTVTVALAPAGPTLARTLATVEEVRARGGHVIALCTEGDDSVTALAEHSLAVPPIAEPLTPCLLAVPLQLLAYHLAVLAGRDVDRPRHLAKSVTVE